MVYLQNWQPIFLKQFMNKKMFVNFSRNLENLIGKLLGPKRSNGEIMIPPNTNKLYNIKKVVVH